MPSYLLHLTHGRAECPAAYAAWRGFDSPLRRRSTISSCLAGSHDIWWRVDAKDAEGALAQLPEWVARRTLATEVRLVEIP